MNLLALRQKIRSESGRYDLVNADGSDNGLDFHINAGQRHLDRMMDNSQSIGRVFKDIVAGEWLVTFKEARFVKEVWCIGPSDEGSLTRLPLEKHEMGIEGLRGIDRRTLRHNYTAMTGDVAQARPAYYGLAQLRLQVDDNGLTGGVGGFADVLADGYQVYNGVVFLPPSDGDYRIEVVGNFYTMTLSEDTDSTFWSDRHPEVLIMATLRQLEIMQRNSEGVKDWSVSIKEVVVGIDMDMAAEESADVTEMHG